MRSLNLSLAVLGTTSVVAGLLVACSSSERGAEPSSAAAGSESLAPVSVSTDVRFAGQAPTLAMWSEPLLDVYSRGGAEPVPLVVILPPHSLTKSDSPAIVQLAEGLARGGSVVAVANGRNHPQKPLTPASSSSSPQPGSRWPRAQ